MKKPTPDLLWKAIIEDLFEDFLHYFFSKYIRRIDLDKGFVFLDKELQTIYPKSDTQNRRADKLVKVWLKNGKETWILIHIEVQGYKDKKFDFRIYSTHYRIRDKYGKPVSVLAIYTDDNTRYHPKEFSETCLGTITTLTFNTFKLLDHPPKKLRRKKNVFAIVMEVAWYGMKRNKLNDEHLLELSKKLIWKLARSGESKETIAKVLEFVKYHIHFDDDDFLIKFEKEIDIVNQNNETMGIFELSKKIAVEEAEEKALEKGMEKGLGVALEVMKLLKENKSVKDISKILGLKISFVEKIKNNLI